MDEAQSSELARLKQENLELKQRQEIHDLGLQLTEDERKVSPQDRQQVKVAMLVLAKYDIIRVVTGELYYYRTNDANSYTYSRMSERVMKNILRNAYHAYGIPVTGNKLKNAVDTLKENVENEINSINRNIIEVLPGFYWNNDTAQFSSVPDEPCFIRLFDNTDFESQSAIQIDMPKGSAALIKANYRQTLKWLETLDGDLPDPDMANDASEDKDLPFPIAFDFIWTWACHSHGTYMDMLKMIASIFMKNKPMGAFILTGLRRNGKSTMVKMIHTLLGRANTSSVRLSELSMRHKNLTLATTLFNAPDEETEGKDMDADSIANFKSMAAHEPILLPVMYAPKPQWVPTNFVSVSPMNAEPDWKGSSAPACMQRSLIIGFHADLSKFDNSGKDFARETFTPYMYQNLLGVVLAIAHYYKDKPLTFSEDMAEAREIVGDQVNNIEQYADLFVKWFIGYKDKELVYADYRAWCKRHGGQFAKQKDVIYAIKERGGGAHRTKLQRKWADAPIDATRLGPSRKGTYFLDKEYIPELKSSIEDILFMEDAVGNEVATDNSVVEGLENWLSQYNIREARKQDGLS